ncbi:MAG: hypothetical protein WD013_00690 [Gemmatimonadota bacterium]
MGRLLLLLLIALGVALYFPRSRDYVLERADPLADPAYRWMTRQEMRQIATDLDFYIEREGRTPLRRGEFDSWLDDRYPELRSRMDAWGTRYRATQIAGATYRIVSAGPDLEFQTSDDLVWDPVAEGN